METYYIWLVLFAIVAYIIVSDRNVSDAFVYIFDIIKNNIIKQIWWLKNNPKNPVVKYLMWRRSMKMAKDLMKEFEKNAKSE
jgi:DNA modification methylase